MLALGPPQFSGPNVILFMLAQSQDFGVGTPVNITVPFVAGSGNYIACNGINLPPGLTFAPDGNNNGLLSGIPTSAGNFTPQLNVADDAGNIGQETFQFTVTS